MCSGSPVMVKGFRTYSTTVFVVTSLPLPFCSCSFAVPLMYVFSVRFQLPCWGACPRLRVALLLCARYSTIARYHYSGTTTQGGGGALLTRKRHIPPHPAQPQHTNHWAPRTRKQHQQEHRPQRPTERSDPTQHAKGRTGDCPGPRKCHTGGWVVVVGAPFICIPGRDLGAGWRGPGCRVAGSRVQPISARPRTRRPTGSAQAEAVAGSPWPCTPTEPLARCASQFWPLPWC